MACGNEGGENIRFKHKKSILKKSLRHIYVALTFLHFQDHL
jgi:hypothetical protein